MRFAISVAAEMENFNRALKFAVKDFYRNKSISISAVFVLTLTILLVTGLFFMHGASSYLINTIQNKIDITAYFEEDAAEQDIISVKNDLQKNFPSIKSVEYVSKEDALNNFLAKHQGDKIFTDALTEVGGNPFLPSLNIITGGDTSQYQQINNALQSNQYSSIIDSVDFSEKKATIDKIFSITRSVNYAGLSIGVILILIALAVVFNTIKLIISGSKEEINTMKLVGASNWFIKAPFIIEGGLFGLVAFIISFLVTVLATFLITGFILVILPGFSLFDYFLSNFFLITLVQLVFGIGLGVVSSLVVVRKYLEV